ncbi:hypothetical protein GAR06_00664 [Micromonospora saelicesensis]|uniref:hypothetical protein n=1 Tax=Micromonospora saelicesensis TaxID=285676 RepID=UPI000DC60AAE|nr:hypothetical protein [Micromonospora saelicesensis]RAO50151.1 hypothetical protein GAR06_00664 [Micromonospora saelicesensis]
MNRWRDRTRPALAALAPVVLLAVGCTHPTAAPAPRPDPEPATRPGTVARAAVGDRLTVTAAVEQVITDNAFIVRDADLTDGTLLVLSTGPSAPAPPQLVTVVGTVVPFSHRDLANRYHLGPAGPYRTFEGGRALAAQEVTIWGRRRG